MNGTFDFYSLNFGILPTIGLGVELMTYETFDIGISDIPDISQLDHFIVMGNVFFGRKITLRDKYIISCDKDNAITVSNGSICEE